jgi:hypothetical protein
MAVTGGLRLVANLVDLFLVVGFAALLYQSGLSPWLATLYYLVRDLPPTKRSLDKMLTGIRVYSAADLQIATASQLLIRGLANLCIVVPLGALLATFYFVLFGILFGAGLLVSVWGRNSAFLRTLGYDFQNGQTVADRVAGTRLCHPRDVRALASLSGEIGSLRQSIAVD